MRTPVKNILPEHFQLRRGMGNLTVEDVFDLGRRTATRRCNYKGADVISKREAGLMSDCEHVHDLGGYDCFGYAFRTLQADALDGDGFQTSAIVQAVGLGIPENRIDIQEIVPQ